MKMVVFLAFVLLAPIRLAYAERTCFTDHVSESLSFNSAHFDEYSRKSLGKTKNALALLMASEALTIPVARYFDYDAAYYHKKGIDLFCKEFVPMSHRKMPKVVTPNDLFEDQGVSHLDLDDLIFKMKLSVKYKDQPALLFHSLMAINEIEATPRYGCLLRHLIESVYRIAYFIPFRENQALNINLKSPAPIMWRVIENHISSFKGARFIDAIAFDAQKNGVPVLCADLPDLLHDLK